MAHPDPESAARGDIPARFARTLGLAMSPEGDRAVVLLGTNEPPAVYPYEVICARTEDGWEDVASSNGCGWTAVSWDDSATNLGVETVWGEASAGVEAIAISFNGGTVRAPVVGGYYFWVAWDVPDRFGFPDPVMEIS